MKGMYNKLPHSVRLNGEKFIINTDFRIFVDFEYEMQEIDRNKAVNKVLKRFYPAFYIIVSKNLLKEAVDKFLWFYQCGKEELEEIKHNSSGKKTGMIYSYKWDDQYIWGAFKMYFNVDLTEDKVHWWKFKSMWNSIPSDSEFNKIKGYRSYTGKDKNLKELKEYYKLPLTQKEKQDKIRREQIYEALK